MAVKHILAPHTKDLGGGFLVKRLLPSAVRQAVGPFVFFDHFGPVHAQPGDNHDVRPHPHIGLSTVTYLFEGAMMHRDSLGTVQRIAPGAINLMTAGRGIVHSERTPDDLRDVARTMHGLQLWCALPADLEDVEPRFVHTPAADIPEIVGVGYRGRVMIGSAFGVTSPVAPLSPTLYVDLTLTAGARVTLAADGHERAVYGVTGDLEIDGTAVPAHQLAVLTTDTDTQIAATQDAHFVVIGGAPLGHRHMVWNFVAADAGKIEAAKAAWRAGAFPPVPGETEFIPLP